MRMAQRKREGCESSLKTSGEEIWYGMLATHRLKKGRSSLSTSEWMSCSLCTIGVDDTRFCRAADEAEALPACAHGAPARKVFNVADSGRRKTSKVQMIFETC